MEVLATKVLVSALDMVVEIAWNERVVSLPPVECQYCTFMVGLWPKENTFQDSSISGFDRQRCYISDDFWACFKNNQENSNRTSDPLKLQTII